MLLCLWLLFVIVIEASLHLRRTIRVVTSRVPCLRILCEFVVLKRIFFSTELKNGASTSKRNGNVLYIT